MLPERLRNTVSTTWTYTSLTIPVQEERKSRKQGAEGPSGWLDAKIGGKKFKKVFCILQGDTFRYYKDESLHKEQGSTVLLGMKCKEVDKKELQKHLQAGFRLFHPTDKKIREFVGGTPTVEEGMNWMQCLTDAIEEANPNVFGINLSRAVTKSRTIYPAPVYQTIEHLKAVNAAGINGIFRVSGSQVDVQQLRAAFDSGEDVDMANISDPHVVSNTLKLYLRELPDPLLTYSAFNAFLDASRSRSDAPGVLRSMIRGLPLENRHTLQYLMEFLVQISAKSEVNMMNPHNLAVVFGPTILHTREESLANTGNADQINYVCETFINSYDDIFSEIARETAAAFEAKNRAGSSTDISSPPPALVPPPPPPSTSDEEGAVAGSGLALPGLGAIGGVTLRPTPTHTREPSGDQGISVPPPQAIGIDPLAVKLRPAAPRPSQPGPPASTGDGGAALGQHLLRKGTPVARQPFEPQGSKEMTELEMRLARRKASAIDGEVGGEEDSHRRQPPPPPASGEQQPQPPPPGRAGPVGRAGPGGPGRGVVRGAPPRGRARGPPPGRAAAPTHGTARVPPPRPPGAEPFHPQSPQGQQQQARVAAQPPPPAEPWQPPPPPGPPPAEEPPVEEPAESRVVPPPPELHPPMDEDVKGSPESSESEKAEVSEDGEEEKSEGGEDVDSLRERMQRLEERMSSVEQTVLSCSQQLNTVLEKLGLLSEY